MTRADTLRAEIERLADQGDYAAGPIADIVEADGAVLVEHHPNPGGEPGIGVHSRYGYEFAAQLEGEDAQEAGAAEGNVITVYQEAED